MSSVFAHRTPAFILGEQFPALLQPVAPKPPRPPQPNIPTRIMQPSFKLTAPAPSRVSSIDEIEALRVKQEGIKVRLGESTLGEIEVPKRDARGVVVRDADGNVVMVKRKVNLATLAKVLQSSLQENIQRVETLGTSLRAGAVADKDELMLALAQIMRSQANVEQLTASQLGGVARGAAAARIPRDPAAAGIRGLVQGRFATKTAWERADGGTNAAIIRLYLLAHVQSHRGLTPVSPVFGLAGRPVKFDTLDTSLRNRDAVLDMVTQTLWPSLEAARVEATRAGVRGDAPLFNALTGVTEGLTGESSIAPVSGALGDDEKHDARVAAAAQEALLLGQSPLGSPLGRVTAPRPAVAIPADLPAGVTAAPVPLPPPEP